MDNTDSGAAHAPTLRAWLLQPFNAKGDILSWFLFLGFAIIVLVFWRTVLNHIFEGV